MAPELAAVVIDNASSDGTVERATRRHAQTLANAENRGFAGAVNQGFRTTTADLVLLVNPDVRLRSPIGDLIEASQQYGLAAGQLTDSEGQPQAGFSIRRFPTAAALAFELLGVNRLWPGNAVNRRYRYLDRDLRQGGPVEQPAGAFLMIRRDVWNQLGGFDESFHPVWFEDVDFCLRASKAGYRIEYVPKVQAEHTGGHSVGKLDRARRQVYWYDSLLRYAAKHYGNFGYRGVCLAAGVSSVPRTVAGMIQERSLSPVVSCFKILYLTGRRLVSRPRLTCGPVDINNS